MAASRGSFSRDFRSRAPTTLAHAGQSALSGFLAEDGLEFATIPILESEMSCDFLHRQRARGLSRQDLLQVLSQIRWVFPTRHPTSLACEHPFCFRFASEPLGALYTSRMRLLILWLLLIPRTAFGLPVLAVDPDAGGRLDATERARVEQVIRINQTLLGAEQREYCPKGAARCLKSIEADTGRTLIAPQRVESIWPAEDAGTEWPTRLRPKDPRRLQVRVHWRKGEGAASRSVPLLLFTAPAPNTDPQQAPGTPCVFPIEHWEWSGMARPERFAMAPRGICGDKELSVTDLIVQLEPAQPIWAIRFLSLEEGRKWLSDSLEELRQPGTWTADHGYAKFFFLQSMRWWRGGGARLSPRYAAAVRINEVPLLDLQGLSTSKDAFLDLYEDGAQIELTVVSRKGLGEVLGWPMELLLDASGPEARRPDLRPAPDGKPIRP